MKTNLSKYDNSWYSTKASFFKRMVWYFINVIFFINPLLPLSSIKIFLLRLFGAKIGRNVGIKPNVNIKYPWLLTIGNNVWIGEKVWIDNLCPVKIGDNSCLSQGSMLLTGNHNYKLITFDLIIGEIELHDGVWIGAHAIICPGVTCHSHSILTVNSVAVTNLKEYGVYQGNPASLKKMRIINEREERDSYS